MKRILILILLIISDAFVYDLTGTPELPREFVNTAYVPPTGRTITVASGGNPQSALDQALPGDEIVITAGTSFTGHYSLPVKVGARPIIVRTSNMAGLPPEGTRVTQANAQSMAKLVSPDSAAVLTADYGAASGYRFIGIEFTVAPTASISFGIIRIGDDDMTERAQMPGNVVFDRCYVHGNPGQVNKRGMELHGHHIAVIDSRISDFKGPGVESQAIAGWNGGGPIKIVNNYIEGACENVMFGGADAKIANLVLGDVEFRRNTLAKPAAWNPYDPAFAGVRNLVKNIFELKNAERVLVDSNIFEGCWVDGQTGFAMQFTPRNQDGANPWATLQDVTFTNNIVRDSAGGINIMGTDNNFPSGRTRRIKIENNLFVNIGTPRFGPNGRWLQVIDGPEQLTVKNNTAIQTHNVITFDGATPLVGFVYQNNVTPHNEYGVMGSGRSFGTGTLNFYAPGALFDGNVLVGGLARLYPAGNHFPADMDAVGFVDHRQGDYRIAPTSQYAGKGVDFARLPGAVAPPQPPPPPTVDPIFLETTGVPVRSSDGAAITLSFTRAAKARIEYGQGTTFSQSATQSDATVDHTFAITGIQSGRVYNYRVVAIDAAGNEFRSRSFSFTVRQSCK